MPEEKDDSLDNIQVSISMTKGHREMINELQRDLKIGSVSGVIQFTIINLYRKMHPNYMVTRGTGQQMTSDSRSIERRAKDKVAFKKAEKEAEREIFLEKKRKICIDLLEGKVDGPSCLFTVHNMFNDFDQVLPLDMVNEELAKNLYVPDKESVLKVRADNNKTLKEIKKK